MDKFETMDYSELTVEDTISNMIRLLTTMYPDTITTDNKIAAVIGLFAIASIRADCDPFAKAEEIGSFGYLNLKLFNNCMVTMDILYDASKKTYCLSTYMVKYYDYQDAIATKYQVLQDVCIYDMIKEHKDICANLINQVVSRLKSISAAELF